MESVRRMKKLAWLLCLLFAAGVAFAQETEEKEAEKTPEKVAAVKTHDFEAEVVSADFKAKTITIKGEEDDKTFPVGEKALASLKEIKGGEDVTLTCEDDDEGEHKQIVAIDVKKPEAPEKE